MGRLYPNLLMCYCYEYSGRTGHEPVLAWNTQPDPMADDLAGETVVFGRVREQCVASCLATYRGICVAREGSSPE
jgi:hypothetical protein